MMRPLKCGPSHVGRSLWDSRHLTIRLISLHAQDITANSSLPIKQITNCSRSSADFSARRSAGGCLVSAWMWIALAVQPHSCWAFPVVGRWLIHPRFPAIRLPTDSRGPDWPSPIHAPDEDSFVTFATFSMSLAPAVS